MILGLAAPGAICESCPAIHARGCPTLPPFGARLSGRLFSCWPLIVIPMWQVLKGALVIGWRNSCRLPAHFLRGGLGLLDASLPFMRVKEVCRWCASGNAVGGGCRLLWSSRAACSFASFFLWASVFTALIYSSAISKKGLTVKVVAGARNQRCLHLDYAVF